MVLEFWLYGHFWGSYEPKSKHIWVIDLMSQVTSVPDALNLSTIRCIL